MPLFFSTPILTVVAKNNIQQTNNKTMNLDLIQTEFKPVSEIPVPEIFNRRIKTGIPELDKFVGQGFLPGQSFTLTAKAGGGKTTLIFQMLEAMAGQGYEVGIASCEESIYQLAYTANRLNVKNVKIANISSVDDIVKQMSNFDVLVVDSFHSLVSKDDHNTREHERYSIESLVKAAKETECVCGIICHLTKMGTIKGGSVVLHAVDMNIRIELSEEEGDDNTRTFTIEKNRFGSNNEMSCIMTESGYEFGQVTTVSKDNIATPKKSRREDLWAQILATKGPINLKLVMRFCDGNMHKAMCVLREMVLNDIIVKKGRGNSAKYMVMNK